LNRKESVVKTPAKEITKFAEVTKVDIIVMGSKRLENISKIKVIPKHLEPFLPLY
jgi:nucleotide-binding universal stress UspA family protein